MTPEQRERVRDLALSGLLSGSVLGAGTKFLTGARGVRELLKPALIGGLSGAAMSAGSGALGEAVMGEPEGDEQNAFTKRGAVGGALGGTLIGGAAGALLASGKLGPLVRSLGTPGKKLAERVSKDFDPKENMIGHFFSSLAKNPNRANLLKGSLVGGGTLGAVAGYQGADEGMQMDVIEAERRRRMREEMLAKIGG